MFGKVGYVALSAALGAAFAVALTGAFTQAEVQVAPKPGVTGPPLPGKAPCAAGFVKSGPNNDYTCWRPFNQICLAKMAASTPAVQKIGPGATRFRVYYTCAPEAPKPR